MNACCTMRREVAGDDGNEQEERHNNAERHRISCADVEQHALHKPRTAERRSNSDSYPCQCQQEALSDDQPQDISALRAECSPDRNLLRALGHLVCADTINSCQHEQKGHAREGRKQYHQQTLLTNLFIDQVAHRSDVRYGLLPVQLPDLRAHCTSECYRISLRSYGDDSKRLWTL